MIDGFNRHYRLIRHYGQQARRLFEAADWKGVHDAVRERIRSYDDRVRETAEGLCAHFGAASLDDATWQQLKLFYIGQLINHKQPELAETFFNSVCSKILHRTYFNNDYIFARPAVSTEYIQASPPTYRSYYPAQRGLRNTIRQIIVDFDWQRPFEDLDRDVDYVMRTAERRVGKWPAAEANAQIQVLHSAFYRNKGAYVFGKAINGHDEVPFAIAVLSCHAERISGSDGSQPAPTRLLPGSRSYRRFHACGIGQTRSFCVAIARTSSSEAGESAMVRTVVEVRGIAWRRGRAPARQPSGAMQVGITARLLAA